MKADSPEFYVSPRGSDNNTGTIKQPFKTLERARDAVRKVKASHNGQVPDGGVTVWLRGGRYELTETFVLGPEDSGRESAEVTYRAYDGECPRISGGRIIRDWEKADCNLPGLSEAARGKVWMADVPEVRNCKWSFRQLWADGKRLTRARWPNGRELSFTVTDASTPPPEALTPGRAQDEWAQEARKAWRNVHFDREDMKTFPDGCLPSDLNNGTAEFFAMNAGRWGTMRIPVAKVEDMRLTTAEPLGCFSYYWRMMHLMASGKVGHIENALSLLDTPDEWYLDSKQGTLYYIPLAGENPNAQEIIAPVVETLIFFQGTPHTPVSFVKMEGLQLEHAEWRLPSFGYRPLLGCYYGTELTPLVVELPIKPGSVRFNDEHPEYCLPSAIDLMYAERCVWERCRISHTGASGIGVAEGCGHVSVRGCEVSDVGGHGIHAGMAHGELCGEDFDWKRPEDEPKFIEISDCHVHHVGEMDWGAYGILSSYCRNNRIVHNLVEQLPYSGIAACFTWFAFPSGRDEEVAVEYNHVRDVLQKLEDGSGIYTKDGVSSKSTLRGNLIHGIRGCCRCGLYLDDCSYGFQIMDNVIYDVDFPIILNSTRPAQFQWGSNYIMINESMKQNGFAGGEGDLVFFGPTNVPGRLTPIANLEGGHIVFSASEVPSELANQAGPRESYKTFFFEKKSSGDTF